MIGTIYNTAMILVGSAAGSVFRKGLKEKHRVVLFDAMGLAASGVGISSIAQNMPNSEYPVLFIVSLALGSIIGTALDIDGRFHRLTDRRAQLFVYYLVRRSGHRDGSGVHLRHRHRSRGSRAVCLAGRNLSRGALSAKFHVGVADDGNFYRWRLSYSVFRPVDYEYKGV